MILQDHVRFFVVSEKQNWNRTSSVLNCKLLTLLQNGGCRLSSFLAIICSFEIFKTSRGARKMMGRARNMTEKERGKRRKVRHMQVAKVRMVYFYKQYFL